MRPSRFLLPAAVLLCCALAACGGGDDAAEQPTEPALARHEAYARGTTGSITFGSASHIERISVLLPEDLPALLAQEAGDLSHLELEGAEALVVDFSGPAERHAYLVNGEHKVLYLYAPGTASDLPAPVGASPGGSLSQLRQDYALLDVELDRFDSRLAGTLPPPEPDPDAPPDAQAPDQQEHPLWAALAALEQELGDGYFLDPRYLALEQQYPALAERAQHLEGLYAVSLRMAQQEDSSLSDEALATRYTMELGRRDLRRELLATERALAEAEPEALALLEQHADLIAAIKAEAGEEGYLDDLRFVRLCAEHKPLDTWSAKLRGRAAQQELLALYGQIMELPEPLALAHMDRYAALTGNLTEQAALRYALATAMRAEEASIEKHADAIAAYELAVEEIAGRYSGKEYLEDNDYLKLNIVNESLLQELSTRRQAVVDAQSALDAAAAQYGALEQEHNGAIEKLLLSDAQAAERALLHRYLDGCIAALDAAAPEEGPPAGWADLGEEFVAEMDGMRSVRRPSAATCAEPGCRVMAVTSGDSIYCATHSNKCANCGCYIDGDALWCMDCIEEALSD